MTFRVDHLDHTEKARKDHGEEKTTVSSNQDNSAERNSQDNSHIDTNTGEAAATSSGPSGLASTVTISCEESSIPVEQKPNAKDVTTAESGKPGDKGAKGTEEKDKIKLGWPSRPPFRNPLDYKDDGFETKEQNSVYWSDLTLAQKMAWRKAFLRDYLTETRKTLPYVRKLILMVYRISPWRAVVLFAMNIFTGLLPALTLQTRGNFIRMVRTLETG